MFFGAADWRERLQGEPVLTAIMAAALLLAGAAVNGDKGEQLIWALALRGESPGWTVGTYWLAHDGWGHLWGNLFLLALLSGLLELESRKRLALAWLFGLPGSGLLYWLGMKGAPEWFGALPAVGASMGAYALMLPAFYFFLRVFHAGILLETLPERFTQGELRVGGCGPLYGLALGMAALVGLLMLGQGLAGPEPGATLAHLLGYGVGGGVALGFWHWDFAAARAGRAAREEDLK